MGQKKCSTSVLLARKTPAFYRRSQRESEGEEKAGAVEGQPGARGGGAGAEGEKNRMGRKKTRGLKTREGPE